MTGRRYLSPRERADMLLAQGGRCAICRKKARRFIADHSTPNAWKPGKPDWLICDPCNEFKTYGGKATTAGSDIHRIAKVRRIRGETKTGPRKPIPSRPMQARADPWNKAFRERRT